MMRPETRAAQKSYDRISGLYDFFEWPIEKALFSKWRKDLFEGLEGNILEIGVGTGKNMQYYPPDANVTAIDLSQGMLSKARKRKETNDYSADLKEMDAEDLGFPSDSFDYVISTFVLCSIPDPVKALKEMKRVVKPDGKVIMLEHVLSDHKAISTLQHIHNPFTKYLFGFNIDRDTRGNIEEAGLTIKDDEHLGFYDVFRKFITHA